ncbi:acyl-CoA reductase [Colidextribacter sp. OB.20]|uniref:acyl-CoA reductase n=1 Tax=Colidextribacter sp. OB.20 TaxID=2304568 RepID=UPI00136CB0BF|nr:acyl-CoA reductase [Colidextribacter sp. OB.20]NBI10343.1 acyl-CoA reductase [Colidextribacter sp. OB.20]
MIFANGSILPDSELNPVLGCLGEEIAQTLGGPPLEVCIVLDALEGLGEELDSGALDPLIAQYAPPGAREELARIRPQISRAALEQRLALELGGLAGPRPFGRSQVRPLGVLLHVAPGNMAGLPAFTAVEGLLTGNINLVKLPRGDRGLTLAIFQKLTELEPRLSPWLYAFDIPSKDAASLRRLTALSDGIVTWGGDGAIAAMRKLAPPGCKLIEWGHRLSFAYLSGWEGMDLFPLADHIVRTGGLLCSSCQVIYLDTDLLSVAERFCKKFLPVLEKAAASRYKAPGQAAQAALYARETALEQVVDRAGFDDLNYPGQSCSLTLRRDMELELSHLHGNVLVKRLPRGEIIPVLRRQRGRLQTAGLICPEAERETLAALLARAGVNRITVPGHMSDSLPLEAHDGEYPLRRYVQVVDIEDP